MNKLLIFLLFSTPVFADTNDYVVLQRSTTQSYAYLQESVEAGFGSLSVDGTQESWQEHSVTTSVGVELWRFIDVDVGYSMLAAQNSRDSLENMNGGQLHLGLKLIFSAPLFNLEFGGGGQASKITYIDHEVSAGLYGRGGYGTVGVSRYLGEHMSIYLEGQYSNNDWTGNSDKSYIISGGVTSVSLGVRIWQ